MHILSFFTFMFGWGRIMYVYTLIFFRISPNGIRLDNVYTSLYSLQTPTSVEIILDIFSDS